MRSFVIAIIWGGIAFAQPGGLMLNNGFVGIDTSQICGQNYPCTMTPGNKVTAVPSETTAGFNLNAGTLPSSPIAGDMALDPNDNLSVYLGSQWAQFLTITSSSNLQAGNIIISTGGTGVGGLGTTGSGSVVLSSNGLLTNPQITSFVNTPLASLSCPAGQAFSTTDSNGVPQCAQVVTSVFGRTGAVTAQAGDYSAAQIVGSFSFCSGSMWLGADGNCHPTPHISFTFGWPNAAPPASATFYLTPYWGGTSESSGLASTVYPVWQSCTVDSLTAVFNTGTAPAPSSDPVTFKILDDGTQVGTLEISAPVFSSIAETIYTGSGTGGAVSSGTGLQLQMKTPAWTANPSGMVGGMVIVGCALL